MELTRFRGHLTAPDAFYGNGFDAANNTYLYNYDELEVFAQLGFKPAGLPAAVYGDYVNNSDAGQYDTGWAAGATLGAAKAKGTWQVSAGYQVLDPDAVYAALTFSDFGGGGTDNEGWLLQGAYRWITNCRHERRGQFYSESPAIHE